MTPLSSHNAKVVEQHTQQAEGYARLTSDAPRRGPARHEVIGARPDDEVLDIACGSGSLTLDLAPHVARATGLDLTPAMLDQARAAQARSGASNVEWVEGDGADLPFADGAFSLVTCSSAFHHLEDTGAVLAEMVRVCRPGGRIVVSDVTPDADKTGNYDRIERMRDPSHRHAHSLPELKALGRAFGLHDPTATTSLAGPMPYEAVLATSFPESCTREDLLDLMREDGRAGEDRLGFKAQLGESGVMVTYPVSTIVWAIP